jgi:hypothetical protein
MQRIWPDAIPFRKKRMRPRIHHLIPRRTLRLCTKKIWNPPRRQRTVARKPVSDPQPPKKPTRKASAKEVVFADRVRFAAALRRYMKLSLPTGCVPLQPCGDLGTSRPRSMHHSTNSISIIGRPFRVANSCNTISISHMPKVALLPTLDRYVLCSPTLSQLPVLPPIVDSSKNAYPHPSPILQCICK